MHHRHPRRGDAGVAAANQGRNLAVASTCRGPRVSRMGMCHSPITEPSSGVASRHENLFEPRDPLGGWPRRKVPQDMPGHPGPRLHLRRRQAVPTGSDHRAGLLSACHRFLTYPPTAAPLARCPSSGPPADSTPRGLHPRGLHPRGLHPRGLHPPWIWAIADLGHRRTLGTLAVAAPAGCEQPLAARPFRLLVPDPALSWPRATALRARPHSTRYRFPSPEPGEDRRGLSTDRDRARRRRRAGLRPVRGPARLPPCAGVRPRGRR